MIHAFPYSVKSFLVRNGRVHSRSFDGVTPQYVAESCLYFINIHHLSGHRFQVRPLRRANFS